MVSIVNPLKLNEAENKMNSSLNDLDNKVVVLNSAILPDSKECLLEEKLL